LLESDAFKEIDAALADFRSTDRDVEIDRRRAETLVTQQELNSYEVGASFQKMRGEAVAQDMGPYMFGQTSFDAGSGTGLPDRRPAKRPTRPPFFEDPGLRASLLPVPPELEKKLGGKRHAAILVALALSNSDHHAASVDVLGEKVQPLSETQPGRVESEQERPVSRVVNGIEEGTDFAGAQNDGKSPFLLGERQILLAPLPIERGLVEELQGADALDDRAASEALVDAVE